MGSRTSVAPLHADSTDPAKLPKLLEPSTSLPRRHFLAAAAAAPAVAVCALLSRPREVPAATPVAIQETTPDTEVGPTRPHSKNRNSLPAWTR